MTYNYTSTFWITSSFMPQSFTIDAFHISAITFTDSGISISILYFMLFLTWLSGIQLNSRACSIGLFRHFEYLGGFGARDMRSSDRTISRQLRSVLLYYFFDSANVVFILLLSVGSDFYFWHLGNSYWINTTRYFFVD